jgi:ArsR family transcriptional regulator
MSQPRISQHLRVLKESGILREAREAQKNFYMLNGDIIDRVFSDFGQFLQEDIGKLPGFAGEADRIAGLDKDVCVQNCKKNSRSDC